MKIKYGRLMLVCLAFLISAFCILAISSVTVITAMAGAFLGVVGAYTALDLRAVVKTTGTLPNGEYQTADSWKYFVGMGLMTALFIVCFIKAGMSGLNLELAYAILGPGVVAIIGFIISGIKMNKAATIKGPTVTVVPVKEE